jgi:Helicase associated domain
MPSGNAPSERWEKGLAHLRHFAKEAGHCRVSYNHTTDDGYRLGRWVTNQRSNRERMIPERRQRLEELPGWSWHPYSDQWEEGFSHLRKFSKAGHCRVPVSYKSDDGYRLGSWINAQRTRKETITPDRRQRLEALPRWSWDVHSERWEEGFAHLQKFSKRAGHCSVLQTYKTDDGYRLGIWVRNQRCREKTMKADRKKRLEALPNWLWSRSDTHSPVSSRRRMTRVGK